MKDFPNQAPMVEWPMVEAIPGAKETLSQLSKAATLILATSADVSDESQIRGALKRVGLDSYIQKVYSFKNTGLKKSPEFYRYILKDLDAMPEEAVMVGDSFEKDVLAANEAGLKAIWFNPKTHENRADKFHQTIHSLSKLIAMFDQLTEHGR